jgi:ankyrin repeat protein
MTVWGSVNKKLLKAAENNNVDAIKQCLAKGADIDAMDGGMTALQYAAYKNHLESVQLLLERGANTHLTDYYNRTALSWACYGGGDREIVSLLLARNNEVLNIRNGEGYTPLMLAVRNGAAETAGILLAYKPDLYPKNSDGLDARALAIKHEYPRILEMLNAYEAEFSGFWKRSGENGAKRERRLDNGMLLTEYVDLDDKMYTSIISGDNGQISHSRQAFNTVSRKIVADAAEAVRRLPAPLKALPKPSTGF